MGHGNFPGGFCSPTTKVVFGMEGAWWSDQETHQIKRGGCASDEAEARR